MSPKRATRSRASRGAGRTEGGAPSVAMPGWRWKLVCSLLLLVHLLAVFAPPFNFAADANSPLASGMFSLLKPYIDFCYLDHGYFFFAPEPGPSHLMRVDWPEQLPRQGVPPDNQPDNQPDRQPDRGHDVGLGRETRQFPDRHQQWPRLLYHRHFMLSEWLQANSPPAAVPAEIASSPRYQAVLQRYSAIRSSYLEHLRQRYGGDPRLTRVEHRIPAPDQFLREKLQLTDESLYEPLATDPEDFRVLP